jgi:hypothetical protein
MLLRGSLRRIHADGQVDLSHFRDHILGSFQKASTAAPLKRALFETIPAEAFFFYSGEWSIGEVDRNDIVPYRRKWRIVDNALFDKRWLGGISGGKLDLATATTLRDLATSKYWWSRMFVAEVMVQHKEFRDADLIQRLKTDENELVRNSITSLESADPLRVSPVDQ